MKLSIKKIVDKKFESVINGYSPTQVDNYLDQICSDYIAFEEKINELNNEITNLKKTIKELNKINKEKVQEVEEIEKIPSN